MTKQDVVNATVEIVNQMRDEWVPHDTYNMANNALEISVDSDVIDISVNEDIAPYVPYTNEPWLSPMWNGKKNPNEGWWERFASEFAKRLTTKLRGVLKVK